MLIWKASGHDWSVNNWPLSDFIFMKFTYLFSFCNWCENNLFSINKIVFWLEFFLCLGGLNWHTALLSQLDGSICWELMRVKAVKASLNWNIWFPDLGLAGQVIPSWFVKWNKNSINRVKKETAKLFFDFYFFFKMIN